MAEANWYVVHTYSGYENKVKANIDKTIENRHLEDQILEVRVPLEEVTEVKNGVKKQVSKKMFPGYVLIHMIMNDDTWYVVRNTRGVTGFVGPGSKPVPLTDAEMRPLGIKTENVVVDFVLTVVAGVSSVPVRWVLDWIPRDSSRRLVYNSVAAVETYPYIWILIDIL